MHAPQKVALVTGASRGIGRAIAQAFAEDGLLVAVHFNRDHDAANALVKAICSNGGSAFAVQAEFAAPDFIDALVAQLDAQLQAHAGSNGIDVLVNNAGISSPASYRDMTCAQFDRLFDVNVRGPFLLTQAVLPRLRTGGRIINISSLETRHASGSPFAVPYGMTKAAINAFTVGLARDLGPRQITVNAIEPGPIATDLNSRYLNDAKVREQLQAQTALGRIGSVADIVGVARFLASDDSKWITGECIAVGGGYRL